MPISSTDFVGTFSDKVERSRHEYDTIARFLREADLIPIGARGTYAPKLTPLEAANLIIAFIAADRPRYAVGNVGFYSNLRSDYKNADLSSKFYPHLEDDHKNEDFPYKFAGDTFGQAVAEILGNPDLAKRIESISVRRSPESEGKIVIEKDGKYFTLRFKYVPNPNVALDLNVVKTHLKIDITIDNYLVRYLSLLLGPDYGSKADPPLSALYPDDFDFPDVPK